MMFNGVELEKEIIDTIRIKERSYTKDLYKICNAKSKGYSLNKFRKHLDQLDNKGSIKYNVDTYPYWSL